METLLLFLFLGVMGVGVIIFWLASKNGKIDRRTIRGRIGAKILSVLGILALLLYILAGKFA